MKVSGRTDRQTDRQIDRQTDKFLFAADPKQDYVAQLFLNENIRNFTHKHLVRTFAGLIMILITGTHSLCLQEEVKEKLVITMGHLKYSVMVIHILPHDAQ